MFTLDYVRQGAGGKLRPAFLHVKSQRGGVIALTLDAPCAATLRSGGQALQDCDSGESVFEVRNGAQYRVRLPHGICKVYGAVGGVRVRLLAGYTASTGAFLSIDGCVHFEWAKKSDDSNLVVAATGGWASIPIDDLANRSEYTVDLSSDWLSLRVVTSSDPPLNCEPLLVGPVERGVQLETVIRTDRRFHNAHRTHGAFRFTPLVPGHYYLSWVVDGSKIRGLKPTWVHLTGSTRINLDVPSFDLCEQGIEGLEGLLDRIGEDSLFAGGIVFQATGSKQHIAVSRNTTKIELPCSHPALGAHGLSLEVIRDRVRPRLRVCPETTTIALKCSSALGGQVFANATTFESYARSPGLRVNGGDAGATFVGQVGKSATFEVWEHVGIDRHFRGLVRRTPVRRAEEVSVSLRGRWVSLTMEGKPGVGYRVGFVVEGRVQPTDYFVSMESKAQVWLPESVAEIVLLTGRAVMGRVTLGTQMDTAHIVIQ